MSSEPLTIETVLAIHNYTLDRFGGLPGVRDLGALESALAQPFQTFNGTELYPSISEKAAVLAFSIIRNHPFADGNKRTAAALLGTFLRLNDVRFKPRAKGFEQAILSIAAGSWSLEQLTDWVSAESLTRQ